MTKDIDYSKYKRFFAFGCSFTFNGWPTWANLLAKEMPNATFYNYGISGAGNIYIASTISECNHIHKFNEDDLVIVLWSTFVREDRFINDRWQSHGSVMHTDFYDDSFRKKYFDIKGYIIRDLALIDLTNGYLESLPCDYYDMISVQPYGTQDGVDENSDKFINETIVPTYRKLLKRYKVSFFDVYPWNEYVINDDGVKDFHPSPLQGYNFLKTQGYKLSKSTYKYAVEETNFLFNPHRSQTLQERYNKLNHFTVPLTKAFKSKYGC